MEKFRMAKTKQVGIAAAPYIAKPAAPAASEKPINQEVMSFAPRDGRPLPPGAVIQMGEDGTPRVIKPKKLSPEEKAVYDQLGLKYDQPVPSDLGDKIDQFRKEAQKSALEGLEAPVSLDTPPLQLSPEVDISNLSPEKQQELKEVVKSATEFAEILDKQEASGIDPSIQAAIQAAEAPSGVNVIDDSEEKQEPAQEPAKEDESEPESEKEPIGSRTGSEARPAFCPRCQWDLKRPDTVEVTEEDKANFVTLGLGKKNFQKRYELMGGRLSILIRHLRPYELDAITYHVYARRQKGIISSIAEMTADMVKYRGALQILNLRTAEENINFPAELKEWGQGADGDVLDKIYEAVRDELGTETIYRLVFAEIARFGDLVGKLEAESRNPDFWQGCPRPS